MIHRSDDIQGNVKTRKGATQKDRKVFMSMEILKISRSVMESRSHREPSADGWSLQEG